MERINSLPVGIKRILFTFSALIGIVIILLLIYDLIDHDYEFRDINEIIWAMIGAIIILIVPQLVYWGIIRIVLWIYDGFNSES